MAFSLWALFAALSTAVVARPANEGLLDLEPLYLQLPFQTLNTSANSVPPSRRPRQSYWPPDEDILILNTAPELCCIGQYAIPLEVGGFTQSHPPQTVQVLMDTGSPHLWVLSDCNTYTGAYAEYCKGNGAFSPTESPTSSLVDNDFHFEYLFGHITGSRFKDDVCLAGLHKCVKDMTFGVVSSVGVEDRQHLLSGILGLGTGGSSMFLEMMAQQGVIGSPFFGLTIDSPSRRDHAGDIIFGGVDRRKFRGPLREVKTRPDMSFDIRAIGTVSGSTAHIYTPRDTTLSCVLDTGNRVLWLPTDVYFTFLQDNFPGVQNPPTMFPLIDCAIANASRAFFHIDFGSFSIDLPMASLVTTTSNGQCHLLLATGADDYGRSYCSFGTPLLFSTYAVFDHQTPAIYLAPAANCGSDIVSPIHTNGKHAYIGDIKSLC